MGNTEHGRHRYVEGDSRYPGSPQLRGGGDLITLDKLDGARDEAKRREQEITDVKLTFRIDETHVGMPTATYGQEIPASTFQSVNPIPQASKSAP